jgi:hypothetical protein
MVAATRWESLGTAAAMDLRTFADVRLRNPSLLLPGGASGASRCNRGPTCRKREVIASDDRPERRASTTDMGASTKSTEEYAVSCSAT